MAAEIERPPWAPWKEGAAWGLIGLTSAMMLLFPLAPVLLSFVVPSGLAAVILAEFGERRWGRSGRCLALALFLPGLYPVVAESMNFGQSLMVDQLQTIPPSAFVGVACHGLLRLFVESRAV